MSIVAMGRNKISVVTEGIVKCLIKRNMSYRVIQKELMGMGHSVSVATICRIKKGITNPSLRVPANQKTTKAKARKNATPRYIIRKVAAMISRVNPPTQREMAAKLGVSASTICRIIRQVLNARLRKKCKVHKLSMAQVEKRRQRSLKLYRKLNGEKWKNVVTTDEAMFYLGGSYGRRRVCYVRQPHFDWDKLKYVKRDSFAPGFMAWAGVCSRGKTKLKIIDKGVKVDSKYYVRRVLTPFLDQDVPRLFPGAASRDMVFHQDSAASHTAKNTLEFLKERNVNYISPDEWMPKSPDAAPMDFGIWGILKRRLQKRKIRSLLGLKRALLDEWNKLEQPLINRVLCSWPKRCKLIHRCHGLQIEHLLK